METGTQFRGRGLKLRGAAAAAASGRKPQSRNKQWVAPQLQNGHSSDSERWERGGHRRGRGDGGRPSSRRQNNFLAVTDVQDEGGSGTEDESNATATIEVDEPDEPELRTAEEREQFYQEVSLVSLIDVKCSNVLSARQSTRG